MSRTTFPEALEGYVHGVPRDEQGYDMIYFVHHYLGSKSDQSRLQ